MSSMNPILLASPTQRAGTTLLQRLLCSASNTLIYGEYCAQELFMATQLYLAKKSQLSMGQTQRKEHMKLVLSGRVDHWIPDLMPDPEKWLEVIEEGAFLQFDYLKNYAREKGRPVWGVKMAGWNPYGLKQILDLFPESRLVYIIRSAEDCLRSARAIEMVRGEQDAQQFLQIWQANYSAAQQLISKDKVYFIQYNDLVESPKDVVEKLESFTGAKGINLEVMAHKINNDGAYINPI